MIPFFSRRWESELDEEIRIHLEMAIEQRVARGEPRDQAERAARREFGDVGRVKEATRLTRRWQLLDKIVRDVRYGVRMLAKAPAYAATVIVTMALGVGGTAAAYGIARGLILDPLPYGQEREVAAFWMKTDWTEEEFLYLRGQIPGFREVALYRNGDVMLRQLDAPARLLHGIAASAELFDVLGAPPILGRGFRAGDDVPGAEPVAVLSYGLWQELGADPSIVGTRLTFEDTPRTVIGVMPRDFWFPDPSVRIWTPVPLSNSQNWNSTLVGRVAPGYEVDAMAAQLVQLTAMLDERFDFPALRDKTKGARITPIRDDIIGGMRPALIATLGAMALILLIACANVAALMLGQVDRRSAELALRLALGANRRQLTQQLVVEAMLIAGAAGALGTALAWGSFPVLARALPLGAWTEAATPDWTVFASAMGIAIAGALLVALVPAVSLWRGDLRGALGRARTGGLGGRGGHLENVLVVGQVALAVLIAAGAALLGRSVATLYSIDAGVRSEGVAVVDVTMAGPTREMLLQTVSELTAALGGLPGVQSAGAAQTLPLRGGGYNMGLSVEGRPDLADMTTEYRIVTPGYLETMGITLQSGRTISEADRSETEAVVVINEAFVRTYFEGTDPIGQRIGGDANGRDVRVVGVVADAAERQLTDDATPVRYVAVAQMPWVDQGQSLVLLAAPGVDPVSLLDAARRTVERVAPGVAVRETTTMPRVLDSAVGPARQVMTLLSLLTGLAVTLGAVGVYGVIAHFADRRRRDWAIRIALGLPGSRVVAHVVGHGGLLLAAGVGLGVVAAAGLAPLLSSFLYGVRPIDPIAFAAAGAALLAVGMLAAFVPALRAGMTDPAIVLREQ